MSEPFLAQISIVGFNFPPRGFAFCDGQVLPISQNTALFSLVGTAYGGDGRTTFALPDLRGRAPVHVGAPSSGGASIGWGGRGGEERVTLTENQLPAHNHAISTSADPAATDDPTGAVLAKKTRFGPSVYSGPANLVDLEPSALKDAGGGQSHDNMQPWLAVNFVIALTGLFPSRN